MNAEMKLKWCNRFAALLMGLMLICQFIPFWRPAQSEAVSINGYVWFPTDHEALKQHLLAQDEEHIINSVAYPSIVVMLLCAAGVVFCLWKSGSAVACMLPVVSGVFGLWFYLTTPVMRMGAGSWVHLLLFALMLLTGLAGAAAGRKAARA